MSFVDVCHKCEFIGGLFTTITELNMLPAPKIKDEPPDTGYEKTPPARSSIKTTPKTVPKIGTRSIPSKNLSNVTPILQAMSNSVNLGSSVRLLQ